MRRVRLISDLMQDLRYGLRTLRNSPGFTAVAVLSLALGIGVNTAIFSLADPIVIKSLPVKNPEQLVVLHTLDPARPEEGFTFPVFRYPMFEQLRARMQVFSSVFTTEGTGSVDMVGPEPGNQTEKANLELVSGEYFQVLGVNAVIGRTLTSSDDQTPGVHPVAVLSYRFWQRRFAGDVSVLGKVITLMKQPLTIIGVTSPEFYGVRWGDAPDIWAPLSMVNIWGRGLPNTYTQIMARLRPDVRAEQAQAALDLFLGQIKSEPSELSKQMGRVSKIILSPGRQGFRGARIWLSRPIRILMAVAGLVLLIACANVANLLLARATRRAPEVAVRLMIGAGRLRLLRQFLTESALLAAAGAALGLLFAWWGSRIILALMAEYDPSITIGIGEILDARVLGFTIAASLLTTLLFGLAPALIATRQDLNTAAKAPLPPSSRLSLSRSLVIAQVALSLLLLTGAGLFLQTLHNLRTRDLGFATEQIIHGGINPRESGYKPEQIPALSQRILERLNSVPGVHSATLEAGWGAGRKSWACCLSVDGYEQRPDEDRQVQTKQVLSGYFQTIGLPLLQGRDFTPQEISSSQPEKFATVAIINETMARHYFGNTNPLGKRFGWGDPHLVPADRLRFNRFERGDPRQFEIVGVAKDAVYSGPRGNPDPLIYFPGQDVGSFVVRTAGPAAPLVATIRQEIRAVDRNLVPEFDAHSQSLDSYLIEDSLLAKIAAFFSLLALLLACVGLYGVMSYDVARRTHEIGIRMALGGQRRDVVSMVMRKTMLLVVIGGIIGVCAALASTRFIASRLYGLTPNDPLTIAFASLLLLTVAALAGYLPARRAARVDPMIAIRNESGSLWESARRTIQKAIKELSHAVSRSGDAPPLSAGTLLSEFADAAYRAASFGEVLQITLATLCSRMGVESAILLEHVSEQEYRCLAMTPDPGASDCSLPANGLLLNRLRFHAFPLPLTRGDFETWLRWAEEYRPHYLAEIRTLQATGARIAVPLRTKREIIGVLLLGQPLGREEYSSTEKQVLRNCAEQFALMIENARLMDRVVEQEKLRRDLALAAEVQKRLLPEHPPEAGVAQLAAVSLPARSVGGDYYDFLDVGDHRIGIALADIAGKGIAAALIMSVVQASLRILSTEGDISLPQLAARMNNFLHRSTKSNSYATFFYAEIDEASRRLHYVNAGHNPPYLLRSNNVHSTGSTDNSEIQELATGGSVIGLFPQMSYQEAAIDLRSGDVLIIFTDGVTEALNPKEEEFGEERLKELLQQLVHLPVQEISARISEELKNWIKDAAQHDDLTFIVMKVN